MSLYRYDTKKSDILKFFLNKICHIERVDETMLRIHIIFIWIQLNFGSGQIISIMTDPIERIRIQSYIITVTQCFPKYLLIKIFLKIKYIFEIIFLHINVVQ